MIFFRYETFPEFLPQIVADAPLVLITGLLTLVIGLIWFAAHHHFGPPAAIVITILAAFTVIRGAVLMVAPQLIFGVADTVSRNPPIMLATTAVSLILGAWCTYAGWFAGKL